MSRHHNNLGFGPCKGCILFQSTIAGAVRMSAFYRNSSCATPARVMSPAAAVNGDDEEIAYQLQLEALAESLAPNHKASTPLQASYSSSSTRNSSEQQSGSMVSPSNITGSNGKPFSVFGPNVRPTVGIDVKSTQDGLQCSTSGSSSVYTEAVVEIECSICAEIRPHTSFISTNGCDHDYCSDCITQHAEVKISDGNSHIECPHQNCCHCYDMQQCRLLLSQKSFEILETRQMEAAIPSSLKLYCPFKDCSAFMEKSEDLPREKFVECWSCHRGFCLECNIPWHANQTCGEYRADAENRHRSGDEKLRDLVKRKHWQICTECKRVIELKYGCFHMTCLCGNEFCYSCGAKWRNKRQTCMCKLWDENFIIRQSKPR